MLDKILTLMRGVNRVIAIMAGLILLTCAAFILVDILLRQIGISLGATDEISGYVMAIATSWGMGFALLELSHVRIDFLRCRMRTMGRVILDLFSLLVLSSIVTLVAIMSWPVVKTSIANASRANTSLETPLAFVHIPWLVGWVWFAIISWLVFIVALLLVWRGQFVQSEKMIGVFNSEDGL